MKEVLGSPWRSALDTAATLAFIAACASVVWGAISHSSAPRNQGGAPTHVAYLPSQPIALDGATLEGNASATVAVLEYADFECPYCAKFARETLPDLEARYIRPGKVLLAFRHFPLTQIHPHALQAAEAARCADRQGKFWSLSIRLFQSPQHLDEQGIQQSARADGLDMNAFSQCLDDSTTRADVRQDVVTAEAFSVASTPTFFIGRIQSDGRVRAIQRFDGMRSVKQFDVALERALTAVSR